MVEIVNGDGPEAARATRLDSSGITLRVERPDLLEQPRLVYGSGELLVYGGDLVDFLKAVVAAPEAPVSSGMLTWAYGSCDSIVIRYGVTSETLEVPVRCFGAFARQLVSDIDSTLETIWGHAALL